MKITLYNRVLLAVASLLAALGSLSAQTSTPPQNRPDKDFAVVAKVKSDRVVVRWAPTAYDVWKLANLKGYVLERTEIAPFSDLTEQQLAALKFTALGTFKPYTLAEWKSRTDTTNVANATAAQALYGPTTPVKPGMAGLHDLHTEQINKLSFVLYAADLNPQTADGLGLRFEDRNLVPGKWYCYRVLNVPSATFPTDTAYVVVNPADVAAVPPVTGVYLDPQSNKIDVRWSRLLNQGRFTAYFVERSGDGGRTWQRIHELPLAFSFKADETNDFSFLDQLAPFGAKFQYRVIGVDAFGDATTPSEPVEGTSLDLAGPVPPDELRVTDLGGKFELTWQANHADFPDHAGFYVGRALQPEGPFTRLQEQPLAKETRRWTDANPIPLVANYYVVYAADTKNNVNMSAVCMAVHRDTVPPARPVGLTGTVDTNGIFNLRWTPGEDLDLLGYRVFFATARNREWYQLTNEPVLSSTFTDTIALDHLTEEVFFTVAAFDLHFNPSTYAEPFRLVLPDRVAPDAPAFVGYQVEKGAVRLSWANSSAPDVALHHLERRDASSTTWTLVREFKDLKINTFTDTTARLGATYEYRLTALDDANLRSPNAALLTVTALDRGERPAATNLRGTFDKTTGQLVLSWDYATTPDCSFEVYRSATGQTPEPLSTVQKTSFADATIFNNQTGWEYFVKAVYRNGAESDFSRPLQIKFDSK
jgi:hypothetical protein